MWFDPRRNYHTEYSSAIVTEELESNFQRRFITSLLTEINTEKEIPLFEHIRCAQQQENYCGMCVLKNIEYAIAHYDNFASSMHQATAISKIENGMIKKMLLI